MTNYIASLLLRPRAQEPTRPVNSRPRMTSQRESNELLGTTIGGRHSARHSRLPTRDQSWIQWLVAAALLVALIAVIAVSFWPGAMNGDSMTEIQIAKLAKYSTWYSPVLLWIWHPLYHLGFGPGWAFLLQVGLFIGGTFLLLRRWMTLIGAAVAVCIVSLTPQLFGELALLGRNTWFLSLLMPCFACMQEAVWTRGKTRLLWMVGCVAFAWFTLVTRQNAVTTVFVPLSVLAGLRLSARGGWPRSRAALVTGSLAIGIVSALIMYETVSLAGRAIGAVDENSIGQLYLYDLASMSRDDHRDFIPKSVYPTGTVQTIDKLTSAPSSLGLLVPPHNPIAYPFSNAALATLENRWKHEIMSHPFTYLRERFEQEWWTLGIGHPQLLIYQPGIPANPYGFSTTFLRANKIANDYESTFVDPYLNGGQLFAPWIYLLFCLTASMFAAARPTRRNLTAGVLGFAGITYQIGLFFALMGTNYRYEFPCVAIGEILLVLGIHALWERGRRTAFAGRFASPRPAVNVSGSSDAAA